MQSGTHNTSAIRPLGPLGTFLLSSGILAGTFLLAHTSLHGPPCLFKLLFHAPCPTCGMTRSLMALWHGDLATSFRYHPLGPLLFLLCAAGLAAGLLGRAAPRLGHVSDAVSRRLISTPGVCGALALFLAVWVIRLSFILSGSRFFLW